MTILLLLVGLQIPPGLDRALLAPFDNPVTLGKAALGRELFFDRRLWADESLACADCHRPERAFTDGRPRAVGVDGRAGERNTPTILNRTFGRAFSWDGRAATLEEQVIRPIVNPREMGANLPTVVARLRSDAGLVERFLRVFGRGPDAAAVSHALATYVRTRLSGGSAYDRYRAGDASALESRQRLGLCVQGPGQLQRLPLGEQPDGRGLPQHRRQLVEPSRRSRTWWSDGEGRGRWPLQDAHAPRGRTHRALHARRKPRHPRGRRRLLRPGGRRQPRPRSADSSVAAHTGGEGGTGRIPREPERREPRGRQRGSVGREDGDNRRPTAALHVPPRS